MAQAKPAAELFKVPCKLTPSLLNNNLTCNGKFLVFGHIAEVRHSVFTFLVAPELTPILSGRCVALACHTVNASTSCTAYASRRAVQSERAHQPSEVVQVAVRLGARCVIFQWPDTCKAGFDGLLAFMSSSDNSVFPFWIS